MQIVLPIKLISATYSNVLNKIMHAQVVEEHVGIKNTNFYFPCSSKWSTLLLRKYSSLQRVGPTKEKFWEKEENRNIPRVPLL